MEKSLQDKALKVAIEAAKLGGDVALKHYKRLKHISIKEGAGLVSEADRESEEAIMKYVKPFFPSFQFLGEEGGLAPSTPSSKGTAEGLWVVDPIDGTTNYVHGFPFFCVSIGLEVEGKIEVAAVWAPLLNSLYTATRGHGAFLNGEPMRVSQTDKVEDALLATGFSYQKSEILSHELKDFKVLSEQSRGIRRAGSAALDMCMVASGVFDGFWERGLAPWDTAAGSLLVTEAGGLVTSFKGDDYHFSMKTVLAGNPLIHPLVLKTIQSPK